MKFQGNVDRKIPRVTRFHHQELEMKADELEALFATHKLRVNAANSFQHSVYGRGELYTSYTNRREAKLRRDWELKREEKEVKSSALELKFDRIVAYLQAKLNGVTDIRQDSVIIGPKQMERHSSLNAHSSISRNKESLRKSAGLAYELIPKFEDKNMLLYGKLLKQQELVKSPYLQNKKVEVTSSRNTNESNYRVDDILDRRKSWSGQAQVFKSRIPAPSPNFKPREDRRLSTDFLKGQRSLFSLSSFQSKTIDLKSNSKGW